MEHIYRIGDRGSLYVIGIVFSLGGWLFAVLGVLLALGVEDYSSEPVSGRIFGGLMSTGIGSLAAYVGWDHLFRRPWQIRIWPDGRIEIQRAFRSTLLQVGTIIALEKGGRLVGVEDEDSRVLSIDHTGGSIHISYFAEIDALIADIRALNPYVAVHGWWGG